jgi:NADH-ubiquinone oxidoreductase chain 5
LVFINELSQDARNTKYKTKILLSVFTYFVGFTRCDFDLKKIIALSTLSQLGLMIITICIGLSVLAFFHLPYLTNALFNVLLFIYAGGVIHSMGDSQDIRFMGGLSVYTPFTSSSLMVSNLVFVIYHF